MNAIVIDVLRNRFADQFSLETENDKTFIKFPAKCPEFGNIEIYEDEPGAFIIVIGHFTHCHMDVGIDAHDETELADRIADLLEDTFNDRIICHGAHQTGGGFAHIEHFKEYGESEYFIWSGRFVVTRKPLVKYKHWYTEPMDYSDDTDVSWNGTEKFWLNSADELVVRVARVYAVDEFAFSEQQIKQIGDIIKSLTMLDEPRPNYLYCNNEDNTELWYSFEPVGIQIGGQMRLSLFENWEYVWHNLLELAAFPYRYEDNPDFTY